jgi:hypothetical protein
MNNLAHLNNLKRVSNCIIKSSFRLFLSKSNIGALGEFPTLRVLALLQSLQLDMFFCSSGIKRADIIHTLTNGTVTSSDTTDSTPTNLLDPLSLNHSAELERCEEASTSVCESDARIPECCSQCGK